MTGGGASHVRKSSRFPASGAHPTRVVIIRSRSNLAKILGQFAGIKRGKVGRKSCPVCEQPPNLPGRTAVEKSKGQLANTLHDASR